MAAVPLIIVAVALIGYRCQKARLKSVRNLSTAMKVQAAENLFRATDLDGSGYIDEAEFNELSAGLLLRSSKSARAPSRSTIVQLKRASQKLSSSQVDDGKPKEIGSVTVSLAELLL